MSNIVDWKRVERDIGEEGEAFLRDVLQELLLEADQAQVDIERSIDESDFKSIRAAAHKVKGSASYLYCSSLQSISEKIQFLCDDVQQNKRNSRETLSVIRDDFRTFKYALDDVRIEIERKFPRSRK